MSHPVAGPHTYGLEVVRHAADETLSGPVEGVTEEACNEKADHRRRLRIGLKLAGSDGQESRTLIRAASHRPNIFLRTPAGNADRPSGQDNTKAARLFRVPGIAISPACRFRGVASNPGSPQWR
jgi:hypothetical protein